MPVSIFVLSLWTSIHSIQVEMVAFDSIGHEKNNTISVVSLHSRVSLLFWLKIEVIKCWRHSVFSILIWLTFNNEIWSFTRKTMWVITLIRIDLWKWFSYRYLFQKSAPRGNTMKTDLSCSSPEKNQFPDYIWFGWALEWGVGGCRGWKML